MGIVEVTPSTLAPSVGNGGAGLETSSAPSSATSGNSPIRVSSSQLESINFTKHSPASRTASDALDGSVDLHRHRSSRADCRTAENVHIQGVTDGDSELIWPNPLVERCEIKFSISSKKIRQISTVRSPWMTRTLKACQNLKKLRATLGKQFSRSTRKSI